VGGTAVGSGVGVAVLTGVSVGAGVGVAVLMGVRVGSGVGVFDGVGNKGEGEGVGVIGEGVAEGAAVGVALGTAVGVGGTAVGVGATAGVGVMAPVRYTSSSPRFPASLKYVKRSWVETGFMSKDP